MDQRTAMLPGPNQEGQGTQALTVAIPSEVKSAASLEVPRDLGAADLTPRARLGRFEIVSLLGEGAMGKVYKAFDPALNRHVALKLLRGDDPALVERFFHEAKAQGSLDHPHICRVFEVGTVPEVDGRERPYIIMQLIQGKTLREASGEMSLEQKVLAIRDAAQGLHEAHRAGIIHRDIKPGNLLVERDGQGGWRTTVLDFGLAKGLSEAALTQTGIVLGTPYYMSPEQARGESQIMDRRSDVYSLGASLFELLAGEPPFKGRTGADVLLQVLHSEPPRLQSRVPRLPVDLATIVDRCLEKDPSRRYDSARSLAEDLSRFLNGEPILARRQAWPGRATRWVRRNRLAAAGLGAALILLLLFIGFAIRAQLTTFQVARVSGRLGRAVQEMEAIMQYAYLLPPHDIARERQIVRARFQSIEADLDQLRHGPPGLAPYFRGRGHLVLREYEVARKHLEEAWLLDYREPEVAEALGLCLGEIYRQKQQSLQQAGEPSDKVEAYLEQEFRHPARERLAQAQAQRPAPYLEAWLAFLDRDHARALIRSAAALEQEPWRFEAKRLEAEVRFARLVLEGRRRTPGELEGLAREAEAAFQEAARMARSDPAPLEGLLLIKLLAIERQLEAGTPTPPGFEAAFAQCAAILALNPYSSTAYLARGYLKSRQASRRGIPGPERLAGLQEALEDSREAARLDPGNPRAWLVCSLAAMEIGGIIREAGRDPRPALEEALGFVDQASRTDDMAGYWSGIALANGVGSAATIAQYEFEHGLPCEVAIARAEAFYAEGRQRDPALGPLLGNHGLLILLKGRIARARGQDARPSYRQAIDAFRAAAGAGLAEARFFEIEAWNALAESLLSGGLAADRELAEAASRLADLPPGLFPRHRKQLVREHARLFRMRRPS